MTGQVDFDSHSTGLMQAMTGSINLCLPGWAHGREYLPPPPAELVGPVRRELDHAATRERRITQAELAELVGYLHPLRAVFTALDDGDLDTACERVNTLLADTGAVPILDRHDGEPWHVHFHPRGAGFAIGWAAGMATALAIVLGGPGHDRLGVCSAPCCDRVYLDTSRNGAKRFCSTACQNRVKAAAFRERNRA